MSVLPKGRTFTENVETRVAVLSKRRSSTANSGTKVAVLLGINRCGSFPLLSVIYYLFIMALFVHFYDLILNTVLTQI